MTATLYSRGQMVIPAKARKEARLAQGDVLNVEIQGDGKILLVRLERPEELPRSKAKLVRRKGTHPVLKGTRKPTAQELKDALADRYLADLTASRGLKLATLDKGIAHPAVELIN